MGVRPALIRDLAVLRAGTVRAGKRLSTFTLETEVGFASAEDRRAFTEELATTVAGLVAKYGNEETPARRRFRFVIGAHPTLPQKGEE